MKITFVTRKFRNGQRNVQCDVVRITTKWVFGLTLDCNGVFAIKAYIHQSPLNPPDCATTISCLIKNGMNDRTSPGCGRQGNACGCEFTPTSSILIISIHNPTWVQESVVKIIKKKKVVKDERV